MINRRKEIIKNSEYSFSNQETVVKDQLDFSKIKTNTKQLDDAILKLGSYSSIDKRLTSRENVLRAIYDFDYQQMREISNFFFKTSGIYSRICKYMAYLYRYDWMITPYINDKEEKTTNKMLEDFHKALNCLDNFGIKKFFGEIALKVIKNGCYYGYLIDDDLNNVTIQELPIKYCRSRFSTHNKHVVEFNMKYFDDYFKDTEQRIKILNIFPEDFKKGYIDYKKGKLLPQFNGDTSGWYLLDTRKAFKFNLNEEDSPAFISVIPAIIDLDAAKDLDRKKMEQRLLKIIIQKMPIDKNGDLVFDVDEAAELHNNAVRMLGRAIGIDVLTTFADVEVADMDNSSSTNNGDELEKVERGVYNEAGVSQMQFNTDGNLALEKSIANDESAMYNLILQFEQLLNVILEPFNKKPKKYYYRAQLLTTTIYNYKEMSKLYKEQMQIGFSKILPQIALGQSQSSILANAVFENDILDLVNVFIPPLMSSTMNAEALKKAKENSNSDKTGRPEKEDDQKSEKTIMNQESQS